MSDPVPPTPELDGGVAHNHPGVDLLPILVGPSTKNEKNTVRFEMIPVACWRLNDVRFEFGSSFVRPDTAKEFLSLSGLIKEHPGAPLSVFGHADPVGSDDFNKHLAGDRAEAIYAVLIRDAKRWERIYNSDNWGTNSVQVMLRALGFDPTASTSGAIKSFQSSKGATPSGTADASTREKLFLAYMDFLCKDSTGKPYTLKKTDFLAKGVDAGGKGDFQGCGEFNPLLVFSKAEDAELNQDANKSKRNSENGPNRRVMVFLFRTGSVVNPTKWPCPRASEGNGDCKKREWSDGEKRRAPGDVRREFKKTTDTFACRFYHRLAISSPCEGPGPVGLIKLLSVDKQFAPSVEKLDIKYKISAFAGKNVKLVIEGENYKGKTLFERPLTDAEKTDGDNKPLEWDGKISVGDRKDRHATPLLGPFKVKLVHDGGVEELPFKILYHSIELAFGKHTADGKTPDEAAEQTKFVQFKLNELGYDAGPVDGTLGTVGQNAIRRFQRAHYKVGTQTILTVNGNADADTIAALKVAKARQVWETGKTPLTQDAKYYIYDNFMNDPDMNFVTGPTTEFDSADRKKFAEDKMERPFLPLEAEVKLQNKAGAGVSAPDAVGDVPVAWEMDDTVEDATVIAATNPSAQIYTKHAREIGLTAVVAGAARIDASGDNALDTFDGFRKSTSGAYVQSMFPKDAESSLEPYKIDRYDKEARGTPAKDFHRAIIKAWDDSAKFPERKGRAGLYFRLSFKGGDDAKVRVAMDFKGLPNEKQLTADHKPVEASLVKETGRWTTWRRTRVSAYCTMVAAPPRPSGLPTWANVAARWREAFIELENNGTPDQTLVYTTVVPEAVYKATIMAMPNSHRPAGVTNANLIYRADSVYGGAIPPQNNGELATDYTKRAINLMKAWCVNPINALLRVVHDEARKTSPEGFVIFDFRLHPAISGQDWVAATNSFVPTANPAARNRIGSTAGYVRCAGAVTMNVDNKANVDGYVLHECSHARFLYHHITNMVPPVAITGDNPTHHDHNQQRCMMSYLIGGDDQTAWNYPLCGKCLLRLRGWNVTTLPKKYT